MSSPTRPENAAPPPGGTPQGAPQDNAGAAGRRSPRGRVASLLTDPRILIGSLITLLVVALAVLGPVIAPYGENQIVGDPFSPDGAFLGTDYLGQDVLSRVLHGGASVLLVSLFATILGVGVGVIAGVVAAYAGGWIDEIVMRLGDVLLAFPQILLALAVLSAVEEPSAWMIVLLVALAHAPRVARVCRGVALQYVTQDFVRAAEAMGESRWRIGAAEIGPNLVVPLLAETGLRFTYSIGMVAGIGFLGFATDPGAADWGQMASENRLALLVQPWGVVAPVLLIALLTIGTNLVADGLGARAAKGDS
ncbi:MAG: ABC transporter permease [Mobilicoccus sp.]|nr:ABC transporter permease [Mobilicoccus sp.]